MFNKKLTLISILILLILSVFVIAWAPAPPPDGDDEPPPQPPQNTYDSLQITKVIADVDGKKDTITNNGEKISRDAKEESNIEFKVEVKNIWDKKIEDIEVTVTIKDIDDGDDLEEEDNIDDLEPGNSDDVDFDFDLPLKVDDDNYDVKINIKGKDEDNNIHQIEWELTLEVKKDKHNIIITKSYLSPSTVSCSRTTNLRIDLLNLGRDDEDVKLELKSSDLAINFQKDDIELETGTDNDAKYETAFRFTVPERIKAGTYPITLKTYYNQDQLSDTKQVNLIVKECIQTKQSGISTKSLPPTPQQTLGELKTKSSGETLAYTSDGSIILLLSVILIIVLGLIIFLLAVIMIQFKK